MQRLTYVNLLGESARLYHAPFVLESVSGVGPTDTEVTTLRGAYQSGDTVTGTRKQSRVVTATFAVLCDTRLALYELRRTLCGCLAPHKAFDGENTARLIYENDAGCYWTPAVPIEGPTFGKRRANALPQVTLRFRCERSCWYDIAPTVAELAYSGSGLTLPMTAPFQLGNRDFTCEAWNDGQVDAAAEIEITGRGEVPALINEDTGAFIRLSSPLPEGSALRIVTEPGQLSCRVDSGAGESSNAFGLLSTDTELTRFTLRPGRNRLKYEPGGEAARSSIRVRFYAPFEGV